MDRTVTAKHAKFVRHHAPTAKARRILSACHVHLGNPTTKANVSPWVLMGFVQELTEWSLIIINKCVIVRIFLLLTRQGLINFSSLWVQMHCVRI